MSAAGHSHFEHQGARRWLMNFLDPSAAQGRPNFLEDSGDLLSRQ